MQAYVAHQESLSFINHTSILHDLSLKNRTTSAVGFSQKFVDLISTSSVYNWYSPLRQIQVEMPGSSDVGYMLTFGAIVTTAVSLMLPYFYGEAVICIITPMILDEETAEFLINSY